MEVASPLPFPSQAGTKRPFVFSPTDEASAAAAAAAAGTASASGCSMMEHDSSELMGVGSADTFGQHHHHAAKRRRRLSASADENVANGSSSSAFPAFAPGGFGFPTKAPAAAAVAVQPHGTLAVSLGSGCLETLRLSSWLVNLYLPWSRFCLSCY